MVKKRILIVDDGKSGCLFESNLTSLGFEPVLAETYEEALDILSKAPRFDIIITDFNLSYQDDPSFIKNLKKSGKTKDIPLIATCAFHSWKKVRKEYEMIVGGFVPKPVTKNVLKNEIEKILAKQTCGEV